MHEQPHQYPLCVEMRGSVGMYVFVCMSCMCMYRCGHTHKFIKVNQAVSGIIDNFKKLICDPHKKIGSETKILFIHLYLRHLKGLL